MPKRVSWAGATAGMLAVVGIASYFGLTATSHSYVKSHNHRAVGAVGLSGVVPGSVTRFGGSGPDMWAITSTGNVYLTSDGGSSWAEPTLPVSLVGVKANEVAIAQYATLLVWMVAPETGQEVLFRSEDFGKTWSQPEAIILRSSLSPEDQAALATQGTTPDTVYAQLLDANQGFVTVDRSIFSTFAIATLAVSSNGGQSFSGMVLPTFGPVEFSSFTVGYVSGGPGNQQVYETANGGATWSELGVAGPATANWNVGLPLLSGTTSAASIPIYINGAELNLATVSSPVHSIGAPLNVAQGTGTTAGFLVTDSQSTVFALTRRATHVFSIQSSGGSWTSSQSIGLPTGWLLSTVVSTGAGSALGVATRRSCAAQDSFGRASDCTEQMALFSTPNLVQSGWAEVTL